MEATGKIAVLRSTVDGDSFIVPVGETGIDGDRLLEAGYEISGWLKHPEQYNSGFEFADSEDEADESGAPEYQGPYFTTCEMVVDDSKPKQDGAGRYCERMIAIIGDGAPEFCTEHDTEE